MVYFPMMHRDIGGASWRAKALETLGRETFDLLVIGGGINGAGIARDATLRGLRVAVVEQGDFASGTSSRSSKLIHGGLRYLEQGNVKLVWESTRERERLRRLAPHLVRPMRFVYPLYRGQRLRPWMLNVGLWGYDLLAGIRSVKRHRMLGPAAVRAKEPALRTEGLSGAGEYWDCWTNDARLVVETMRSAADAGAVLVSRVRVTGLLKDAGRVAGATLVDALDGREITCRARAVVNATGPWVDRVSALDGPGGVRLRLTKGVHVIVPRERIGNDAAWVLHARRDRRVMFVIPWGRHSLVGTTDTDHAGGPDVPPRVEADDVAYLLETVNHYAPEARLTPADVVGAYAGLRPLVAPPEEEALSPSAVSREEEIHTSASGLISMAGGKLTTFRLVSEHIVDQVVGMLRRAGDTREFASCRTTETPLPGGQAEPAVLAAQALARDGHGMPAGVVEHLAARYGERLEAVLSRVAGDRSLGGTVLPAEPDARAEVAYAVEQEFALTLEDVLVRRTQLGLIDAAGSASAAPQVAGLMAPRLGWDEDTTRREAVAYAERVAQDRKRWG
jgi:glycerol-3-phosphate dehydrogenase